MADLSFIYDQKKRHSDIQIAGGDFVIGDSLQTSVELSLFTDRRATDSEYSLIAGNTQARKPRRGYWANSFKATKQGSGLWLLQREKRTAETLSRAKVYATSALAWMVKEGIAKSVAAETSFDGTALIVAVSITKPDGTEAGFKYDFAWESL